MYISLSLYLHRPSDIFVAASLHITRHLQTISVSLSITILTNKLNYRGSVPNNSVCIPFVVIKITYFYLIPCENGNTFLHENSMFSRQIKLDRHGSRLVQNLCHNSRRLLPLVLFVYFLYLLYCLGMPGIRYQTTNRRDQVQISM